MATALRLVSFNILEGLKPIDPLAKERRLIDRNRSAAAMSLIADLKPDIMVVNEALYCRLYAGRKVDYAELFGFPHHVAALYDGAWGNAILSRFPIAQSKEMRIYNRGGLSALIETPMGNVTIASYHPHPKRYPENKAQDFAKLLSGADGPLIVCGDFNCISPQDDIDRDCLIEGIVTLSEIVPIWTTDRQAKPLKSHASKSAVVGKFQSIRLNVTTPLQRYCPLGQ